MGVYFDLHHDGKSILSANGATWIVTNRFGEVNGLPTLSQDCGTIGELNAAIDRLQADLEQVRAKGKRLFKSIDEERTAQHA
jgi:hypothetical protein